MQTNSTSRFSPTSYSLVLIFIVSFSFLFTGCLKDDLNKLVTPKWDPAIAFPLINSSLTVEDMINKFDSGGYIYEDPTRFLTLIYKGLIESPRAGELLTVPSPSQTTFFTLSPADTIQLISSGTIMKQRSDTINFNFSNNATINTLILKSGLFDFQTSSGFRHDVQITVTIPSLKKSGVSFSKTYPLTYSGTLPVDILDNSDLSGYTMDLTFGGTTTNTLVVNYDMTVNYSAGSPIGSGTITSVYYAFNSLMFSYIDGYMGQLPFSPYIDTINTYFFKNSILGSITLEEPKLNITIGNSFGLPIETNFTKLEAHSGGNPPLAFTAPFLPGPIAFNYPTISQIGQSLNTPLLMDKNNSNINSIISYSPQQVVYEVSSTANPGGNTVTNFMTDSSRFSIDMQVELPLHGTVNNLVVQDTFELDLKTMDEIGNVEYKIITDNGFPMDVNIQLFFTDDSYTIIDSLIPPSQNIVSSALIDFNGIVTIPTRVVTKVYMDADRFKLVKESKRAIIRGVLNTTNSGGVPVKIYSNYNLDVKVGIKANLNL